MQVLRVKLPQFKNLRDFEIRFSSTSPVSVLVGRNGTGKSNLLEALTIIFRDLDLAQRTLFDYEIEYECAGRTVEVHNSEGVGGIGLKSWVDGEPTRVHGGPGAPYRPQHVFGYYSGPSNRLEEHYRQHQERFYRDLIRGSERPLRPLFYARNVHSNFVLLAFFIENDPDIRRLLDDNLGIVDLESVLFVMQKPSWSSKSGDPRFWNARGTVQTLLNRLYALALAPLRLQVSVATGLSSRKRTEQLFLYLAGLTEIRDVARDYSNNREFFKALESTYISELIADVRIRVVVGPASQPLTFRELSEGEQQLLLVLGLMRFTREEESLFLLDEPDTHLNPAWSVQYKSFLYSFGSLDQRSHVVMATHDPLVVAGLRREEVRIFAKTPGGGNSVSEPRLEPQGMGVGALLTSDIYGLRSQLDLETLEKIDQKRLLASKPSLTEVQLGELRTLTNELRDMGLLWEDRDPEFQEYLKAKHSRSQGTASEPVLSQHQIEENERIAEDIVNRLRQTSADERGERD